MAKTALRPSGTVQHIAVNVADLARSGRFYGGLGFVAGAVEDAGDRLQLPLAAPGSRHQPQLLLRQWKAGNRGAPVAQAHEPGFARLCVICDDLKQEMARLRALGVSWLSEPVTDRPKGSPTAHVVACLDDDGAMVEFVQMEGVKGQPLLVHVNLNVCDFDSSQRLLGALGFEMKHDFGEVRNKLYSALNIPDPGHAKHAALIRTPADPSFSVDLIEWEDPKTQPSTDPRQRLGLASLGICVADVRESVRDFVARGGVLMREPELTVLPGSSTKVLVATVLDFEGVPWEVIESKVASSKL